jgi:Cytochrome c7 and related cytochrome c
MPFGPGANLLAKVALIVLALAIFGGLGVIWAVPRMDYVNKLGFRPTQPVPFSHKHHVGGVGLDCRYCHDTVERSADAGMPSSDTCMTCHSQLFANAPMLEPVRASLAEDRPIHWRRVYDLPDYVYFDHSIHVEKGVACETCHGRVDRMPITARAHAMTMGFCLNCHRDPAPYLRPAKDVFVMGWKRAPDTPSGARLMVEYHIRHHLTDCSICHR